MDNFIRENFITIDLETDPNFKWGDTWGAKPLVDWSQLEYQNMYKRREFIESKFTGQWEHLPGFENVITKMSEKITSPLEEINERYYIANVEITEDRNNTDFFEFKDGK